MRFARRAIALTVAAGFVAVIPPAPQQAEAQVQRVTRGTAKAMMARRLPEVRLQGVSLADAMDFIRDVSGANIFVNWRALEAAGVARDTPVNVRLHGVSLRKVLTTVLTEAGAGTSLTYTIEEDVIEVTTQELADQKMYMKIYPIEDLIMEVPNFDDAPDFNLQGTNQGGQGGNQGGGGGASGGLFSGNNANTQREEVTKSRDERAQEIIDLITSTVRPDVWSVNGGTASVRFFNGSLVVLAPLSVHELIGG